jgi:hypothetical protein
MSGWRDQPRRADRIHSLRGSRDLVVRGLRPNHNEIVRALVHFGIRGSNPSRCRSQNVEQVESETELKRNASRCVKSTKLSSTEGIQ